MTKRLIRGIGLASVVALACIGFSSSASAQYGVNHSHHHHHCAPRPVYPSYGYYRPAYRPIVVYPSYGIGSYSSYYGSSNLGLSPTWGGYGMGSFPIGGSYGGGAFPRGGSYGGGSGFSLYIGR